MDRSVAKTRFCAYQVPLLIACASMVLRGTRKKDFIMKKTTRNNVLFTGLGVLIGTVGIAAITSETAKKGYVHAMAQGMKAKKGYQDMVEAAKAEYDDIVAQAAYISVDEPAAEAEADAE